MITMEEMETILDELAQEFPPAFYEKLNGGIVLLPDIKLHPKHRNNDLFIMGEYHHNREMGRYIVIYYGSFIRVYGRLSNDDMKENLRKTLRHEFRHHIESLAGEKGLIVKDHEDINKYLGRF